MTGDGCSGAMSWAWRRFLGRPPPWEGCCEVHDEPYRKGGSWHDRLAADRALRACVMERAFVHFRDYYGCSWLAAEAGSRALAWAMFLAVRIGGSRWAPPIHLLGVPFVWLGWAETSPDFRWGRVP